jgi:DNA invertase Pin-like site-specific DNA recombinase
MEAFEVSPDAERHGGISILQVGGKPMETSTTSTNTLLPLRAAQYVRMSTEHQQYSPENQLEVVRQYAASHNMEIVQEYSDHGRSGLNIAGREGLNKLMSDVESKRTDFSALLVYDVSRWGRFQDVDESAYYEYVLKRAGIRVHYCAEQFENDGSMSSSVLKTLKRSMAAEYSRELSVKVFSGQCRLIELGFRQGGPAGYGLRRQLIDRDRNPKGLLGRGERKSLQTDRVILVPGPELEIETVRQIYDLFAVQRKTEQEIMETLNGRGVLGEHGRPWTRATVHQVLTNPKYIGANIYNRRSFKLKHKRIKNPVQMWIWRDGAFEPIVTAVLFEQARAIIESRHHHLSDQELLERLRELLRVQGRLSGILIDETEDMPSSSCYSSRFGSLTRAYLLIGWNPDRDYAYIEINRRLRRKHADLIASIFDQLLGLGATVSVNQYNDLLTINCEYTASLILARCRESHAGNHRWHLRFDESLSPDIVLAARLQPGNEEILDYYLLPRLDALAERLSLRPDNGLIMDVYRFNNLNFFMEMAQRVRMEGTA